MVEAVEQAPVTFGMKSPDAGVFRMIINGAFVDVGFECAATPGCKEPPEGVVELKTLLQTLGAGQHGAKPCAGVLD